MDENPVTDPTQTPVPADGGDQSGVAPTDAPAPTPTDGGMGMPEVSEPAPAEGEAPAEPPVV